MENVADRLMDIFSKAFPDCTVTMELARPGERVGGLLIWSGFAEMEQIDRQRAVSRVVREQLPKEMQLQVTTILTLTPEETEVMRAG